jgi:hypothetical protein
MRYISFSTMSLRRLVTFTVTLSPSAKNGTGGILTTRVFEFNEGFQTFRETVNIVCSRSTANYSSGLNVGKEVWSFGFALLP